MAQKENNFKILNQQVVSYLKDINNLKININDLKNKNFKLSERIQELQKENSKLSEKIKKLTKENTDMKSEIMELKEK
ncbi:MAG: hypothetical protein K8R41_03635 [Bacteroidales bacterium]|nr:hypothetical protein [Bacteroidales bacterium]